MIQLVSSAACLLLLVGPSHALAQVPSVNIGKVLHSNRMVSAIVDRTPAVSQEATWTWWNKP